MYGTIRKLKADRAFGFIRPDEGGDDVFFHFSGVQGGIDSYNVLAEGERVSFEIRRGAKDGKIQAYQIQSLGSSAPANDNDEDTTDGRYAA